jgi:ABC-2 type transport system permease protein
MMNRRAVALLALKEARETLNSPMPYIFLTVFFLIQGWFFVSPLFVGGEAAMDGFFAILPLLLTFFIPAFTMRLFAEEYKTGTMEALAALPLRDAEIVLGKYLAALGAWAAMLGLSLLFPAILFLLGSPDPGVLASAYVGALLLGGFYAAAGVFASALTRSQVVAFLLAFVFCFFFFLAGKASQMTPGAAGALLTWFGVDAHLESFWKGVVDSRDAAYFLSGTALFLAGTLASFNSRRWR